jgi:hypothetical protein
MSRKTILVGPFALQAACCAYFLVDLLWDTFWPTRFNCLAESDLIESAVTIALF